jgi:hypothetical protein
MTEDASRSSKAKHLNSTSKELRRSVSLIKTDDESSSLTAVGKSSTKGAAKRDSVLEPEMQPHNSQKISSETESAAVEESKMDQGEFAVACSKLTSVLPSNNSSIVVQ